MRTTDSQTFTEGLWRGQIRKMSGSPYSHLEYNALATSLKVGALSGTSIFIKLP